MISQSGSTMYRGLIVLALLSISLINADEICELRLTECPETFNGQTINVPTRAVRMSSKFFVCMPDSLIEDANKSGSPSIMFVIDHSGSMSGLTSSGFGNDTAGSRFTVTNALLDTISKKFPKAEVGVVLFQNVLFLDTINYPYAVALPSTYHHPNYITSQGYYPLRRLDTTLSNGKKSIDEIKSLLTTKKVQIMGSNRMTTDLVYKPSFETVPNTNINTAFDAAKYALEKASNPKAYQFIIFLSDGEPMPNRSSPELHGNKPPYDFQNGVNVPTTFTVYFVPDANDSVPESISTMTQNIKVNNYSTNNGLSNVWSIRTSYATLLNVLMTQAINPIFSLIKQEPTKLILNNSTYDQYSVKDSAFIVPSIPLQVPTTFFDLTINYNVKKDGSSQTKDSIVHVSFNITRTDEKPMTLGVELVDCYDTIYYQVSVTAPDPAASELGPTNGSFQFKRNNSDHGDLTLYYTVAGTATPVKDYSPIIDSVVFTGNQTSIDKAVTIIEDTIREPVETVIITLLSAKPGKTIRYSVISQQSSATVSIADYFKNIPDTLKIAISPNPFPINGKFNLVDSLGRAAELYTNILNKNKEGMLISVFSNKKLEPYNENSKVYGRALVYDAVGNIVRDLDLIKASDFDSTLYGMVWDGRNRNGRTVGGGSYLMKLSINLSEGGEKVITKKIGIRY